MQNPNIIQKSKMTENQQKKIYIKSYGCQMNEYDSRRILDLMAVEGYEQTQNPEMADLLVLNTCHIREKAAEKVYSDVGRYKLQKQGNAILAIVGCTAQAEGAEMMRRAPAIDMVIGPQNYHNLPKLVKQKHNGQKRQVDTEFPAEYKFDYLPEQTHQQGVSAFLAVQEGCDKFCTFCVVPFTRGAEYSRPAADILREAKGLINKGVREISLLGQNVNAWHGVGLDGKDWNLARLINALSELDNLWRIRYTTSHPLEMDDDLIACHRDNDKLQPWLHLPIQSGSNKILKAMNRRHTRDDYLRIIEKLRHARPDIALSSDFIVGFPGEDNLDFADTLNIIRQVVYASSFSFKYSPRPGTPAADMPQLDEHIKDERLAMVQELLNSQQQSFNHSMMGRNMAVLFERIAPKAHHHTATEMQWVGRSPYMQPVHIMHDGDLTGKILNLEIKNIQGHSLYGY